MSPTRLLYSIADAADALSLSKRKVESLIHDGEIETVPIGRRRLVPAECLTDYIERLRAAS